MNDVHGSVAPGFEPVAEVFRESLARGREIGASFCAWVRGDKVVDLWGGLADKARGVPWGRDTVSIIFSSTKGLAALCALKLAAQGRLDYDAPVAEYWPEFAQGGKGGITVRTLLNHRSGLLTVAEPIILDDLEDPERLAPILARQQPLWEPGTAQGYHGVTFGLYLGELFRRAAGRSIGTYFAEEIARPLGVDAWLGAPEEIEPRVARLYPVGLGQRLLYGIPAALFSRSTEGRLARAFINPRSYTRRAFAEPAALGPKGLPNFDTRRVRAMELPWANAIANARSLATIYAALIGVGGDLPRPVAADRLTPVLERQSWQAPDHVLCKPAGWSQGFIKEETHLFSPHPESFGHPGAGGHLGWADPVAGVAMGYVMNKMDRHLRSPRAIALAHALYGCLGEGHRFPG